jgi:hypothetical protein
MFDFFRRSGPRPLSDAITTAMTRDGQTPGAADFSTLRMVESSGRYSNRKVTYFRVFDPTSAAQRSMDITRYKDFDVFQGLIVRSGHVEQDGTVVMTQGVVAHPSAAAVRTRAGRAVPMPAAEETCAAMDGAAAGQTASTV